MSFRDLKEEIYLVLQIKGGHGFGFATSPLVITANLAGNIHESFVTEPSPQPLFENEFVWVMDKTRMKSIWSDKIPVRVECLMVSQARRSRVGYIILNVKDAQIVHDESKITEKQIRLLGLSKDVSLLKPELILSFYITDVPIKSSQLIPQFSPPLDGGQLRMTDRPPKVILGSGREHFSLSINVVSITNLKQLLPSQSEVEPQLITYTYSLLGAEVVCDMSTNHGVRLAITSSLACLKTYFIRESAVMVRLHLGSLLVGDTHINMENLLLSDDLNLRRSKHQTRSMTCRCVINPSQEVSKVSPDMSSYVDFSVSFSCEGPLVKKRPGVSTAPALTVGAGGDAGNSQVVPPLQPPVTPPLASQSRMTDSGGDTYRTQQSISKHTVTVTVTTLHLEQSLPTHHPLWLRLSQSCGCVSPQQPVAVPISWAPLNWHLTLTLPRRLLESTLSAEPASLQLGTDHQVIATALLRPPENFTSQMRYCTAVLEREGERVGEAEVVWGLADGSSQSATALTDTSCSPSTHSRNVGVEVLSPRARELKMLSFVEELEDWAEKQRIIVMEGLKEEEAARLAALQAQWEAEVGGQVTEGRQLVGALHNMRDQLRHQESDLRDNQLKLKVYKEELEQVHRSKLQEFKDLSRRMQDEFNHKLALIASDKVALEHQVEELRQENAEVKRTLREVETRADADKRLVDSLTHELKMLKEKLSMEQESKKFFKEHCRKAEQEIHRLNCLRQQELEVRLHSEKKSLEQLAFQQIILERNDLKQDQKLLEEIRQQLLQTDINSNSNGEATYRDSRPFLDDRHIRRAT